MQLAGHLGKGYDLTMTPREKMIRDDLEFVMKVQEDVRPKRSAETEVLLDAVARLTAKNEELFTRIAKLEDAVELLGVAT